MINTFSNTDFASLSPFLVLLAGAMSMLLLEAFAESFSRKFAAGLSAAFLLIAMVVTHLAPTSQGALLQPWLNLDLVFNIFALLFLAIGLGTVLLSAAFFQRFNPSRGEFYFLLFAALFGLLLIAAAADFLTLFIGLETLSLALYVLCGYMKKWESSSESSIKYFFMGSLAAAFLLYGIALVYGAIGSTSFDTLLNGYNELTAAQDKTLFVAGVALITLGLAFKAALVPFHSWAPDVYAGAPTPVVAFMVMGTKAGAFVAFIRVFMLSLPGFDPRWNEAMALLACVTLIYANIVALRQTNLRRFFAYSGISHAGFLLMPLIAGGEMALDALFYYLVVYVTATFGAFSVLAFLDKTSQGATLKDLYGLFSRSPTAAVIFAVSLLTLAGMPPTAGFFAKFYIFKVAFSAGYHTLVVVGLLTTVLSAYYYLRMAGVMFSELPTEQHVRTRSLPVALVGVLAVVALITLSVYPDLLLG